MSLTWLCPLQSLIANEHILFYKHAAMDFVHTMHDIWFDGRRNGPKLVHRCEVAKCQDDIPNIFK
jgi:hypothetical protein